jgi:hypothetical protein
MERWTAAELSGKYRATPNTLGGLNPPPRKGDTARLAKYARSGRNRCYGRESEWDSIYRECSAYAALFEQGTLLDAADCAA